MFARGGITRRIVIRNCLKNSGGGGSWNAQDLKDLFREFFKIEIGSYSYGIENGNFDGPAKIGNFVSIGPGVRRLSVDHFLNGITTHPCYFNPVFGWTDKDFCERSFLEIGNDVWIGADVIILPKVTKIGDGAVIGAGAVVTKNVDPYTIVAGNPARKIRDRLDPSIARELQDSEWWNLPEEKLKALSQYMTNPEEFLNHIKD